MLTIKTKLKVTVSGTIKVWAEVYNEEGQLVGERTLPKNAAAGTYLLASDRVMGYDVDSAMANHEPFATVKRRRPIKLAIFGLKESHDQEAQAYYEEISVK